MLLLIPIDKKDYENANITRINEKNIWITIEMDNGYIEKYSFFDNKDDIEEMVDYLIIKDKNDNIEEFLDEGIDVLMAPLQNDIEEIIEAYKFKELYEI